MLIFRKQYNHISKKEFVDSKSTCGLEDDNPNLWTQIKKRRSFDFFYKVWVIDYWNKKIWTKYQISVKSFQRVCTRELAERVTHITFRPSVCTRKAPSSEDSSPSSYSIKNSPKINRLQNIARGLAMSQTISRVRTANAPFRSQTNLNVILNGENDTATKFPFKNFGTHLSTSFHQIAKTIYSFSQHRFRKNWAIDRVVK